MIALHHGAASSELEPQMPIAEPGNANVGTVEPGGDQQRVVGTLLELYHDSFFINP